MRHGPHAATIFDEAALGSLYSEVSDSAGVELDYLRTAISHLFALPRSVADKEAGRLRREPWKKFFDEMVPVSELLRNQTGRVRFPLDDHIPDCWFWHENEPRVGIEVTVALGKGRYHLMNELNEKGVGRGVLLASDAEDWKVFVGEMKRPPKMYSKDEYRGLVRKGILQCLNKKIRNRQ